MIKVNYENSYIFIDKKIIYNIMKFTGNNEKIGVLLGSKIKGVNEYIINKNSSPDKKDISTPVYSEISKRHHKNVKKIIKKNKNLYDLGFFHTHPEEFGSKRSAHDKFEFQIFSNQHLLSIFIIAISNELSIYIYSYGKMKCKETIKWS